MLACTGISCTERKGQFKKSLPTLAEECVDAAGEPRLIVSLCTAEECQEESGAGYTVYALKCVMVGGLGPHYGHVQRGMDVISWMVKRRYSEFYALHTRLKTLGKVRAELPSKNPLSKFSFTRIVQSREIGLVDYLNSVLNKCNDEQCVLLAKFLKVNKHLKSETVSQASTPCHSRVSSFARHDDASSKGCGTCNSTPCHSTRAPLQDPPTQRQEDAGKDKRQYQPTAVAMDAQLQQHAILEGLRRQRMIKTSCTTAAASVPSNPSLNPAFNKGLQPQIAGVGLFFVQRINGTCIVDEIIPGSSVAADGRIRVGDMLLSVDGLPVSGKDLAEIRNMIVGPIGTKVSLELQRDKGIRGMPQQIAVTLARAVPQPAHACADFPQQRANKASIEQASSQSVCTPLAASNPQSSTPMSASRCSGQGGPHHPKVLWNSLSKDIKPTAATITPSKATSSTLARKVGQTATSDGNPPAGLDASRNLTRAAHVEQITPDSKASVSMQADSLGEASAMTVMSLASEGASTVRAMFSFEADRDHELTLHKVRMIRMCVYL
jgi:hypothetical protein